MGHFRYCIDVSSSYNLLGKNKRTSLKVLAKIFLGEDIQANAKRGHSSVEDSLATLNLLRLKLLHGWVHFVVCAIAL